MFFNFLRKNSKIFSLVVVLSTTGCGQFFGEKPPANVLETNIGFEAQCLSSALPIMKSFMAGTAQESEIRGTWQCFSSGISAFQRKVTGSNQNYYRARELAKFFEDYFFKDLKINDHLLEEIMYVKQVFIGGSAEVITRAELSQLISFAHTMEEISIDLLPYMKVYAQNWSFDSMDRTGENIQFFEAANVAIQDAAKSLASIIEKNGHGYSIHRFISLMKEVRLLYNEDWKWLTAFEKATPFVEKLVQSLSGGTNGTIAANEWRRFSLLAGRGYIQFLRYFYFMKNSEEIGEAQVIYLTNSIDDLFSFLGDMVKEKPSGVFAKTELVEIAKALNDLFPKVKITEELINEAMKFKVLLFGGSADLWTNLDFINAQKKVRDFRLFAERFLNFSDVYLMRWKPQDLPAQQAQDFFKLAEVNLIESVSILSKIMESNYNIDDVIQICNEFDKLFPPDPSKPSWTYKIRKNIGIVISLKQIILLDDHSIIKKENWNKILITLAKSYSSVMYFQYFVHDENVFFGRGLKSMDQLIQSVTFTLAEFIRNRGENGKIIKYLELDRLIFAFSKSTIWPKGLGFDSVRGVLRIVLNRILLDPKQRLAQFKPAGLTLEAIQLLKAEYDLWSANQHILESVFIDDTREYTAQTIIDGLKAAKQTEGTKELIEAFNTPVPLSIRQNGLLEIKNGGSFYLLKSASMMNLARIFSRTIIRSYATDMKRIQSMVGVNVDEVDFMYKEIKPILEQIDLVNPDNINFARNRFFEANLFTPASDGNDFMSFREGTHLMLMIFSGLNLNRTIEPIVRSQCEIKDNEIGRRSQDQVLASCAAKLYYLNIEKFYESLPNMRQFFTQLTEAQFNSIFLELLKAADWKVNPEGYAPMGVISLMPHIFQYKELLMQRFDKDFSGSISDSEADLAYPVYGPLINTVSPTKIKIINRTAFYYLIKNGIIPSKFSDIKSFIKDVIRFGLFNKPLGINSNRSKLAQVFGSIADAVRKANAKKDQSAKDRSIDPDKDSRNGVDVDGDFYEWKDL